MHFISRFLCLAAALGTAPAWCADFALGVTASISATCSFTEVPFLLAFPEIDPASTQTYLTSATVRVRCTNGTRLNLSVGGAAQSPVVRRMEGQSFISHVPAQLPYTLGWSTSAEATGGFSASAQDFVVTLTGTLTPEQYQDTAAGHFSDLVTLQLSP